MFVISLKASLIGLAFLSTSFGKLPSHLIGPGRPHVFLTQVVEDALVTGSVPLEQLAQRGDNSRARKGT